MIVKTGNAILLKLYHKDSQISRRASFRRVRALIQYVIEDLRRFRALPQIEEAAGDDATRLEYDPVAARSPDHGVAVAGVPLPGDVGIVRERNELSVGIADGDIAEEGIGSETGVSELEGAIAGRRSLRARCGRTALALAHTGRQESAVDRRITSDGRDGLREAGIALVLPGIRAGWRYR